MDNNKMVPELRFSEFDKLGQYNTNTFESIFNFSSGKNIKQKEAVPEFDIPCVRYGELYHLYDEVITEIINYTNLDKSELVFSEGDEILLPSAGEDPLDIGSASALTLKNVAIGRTINVLKPKQNIELSTIFVSYYINQKLRIKISRMARGASISNVYNSDLKKLKICLPKIQEQQKIANFLTTIDQRTTLLKQKKTALEQYKKGLMQKIFSQEIRFEDDEGNDFPDWEERRLGEVGEFKNGINKGKSEFGFGVPFVNLMDVFGKTVLKKQNFGLVNATDNEIKQYELSEGDVLFIRSSVKRSGVGETIVITENLNKTVYSGFLIRFRDKDCFNKDFKKYCFWNTKFRNQLVSLSTSSANTNINQESLKILKISLPCKQEQQKIANFLSITDKKINAMDKQITDTETFKKGLLQRMFI